MTSVHVPRFLLLPLMALLAVAPTSAFAAGPQMTIQPVNQTYMLPVLSAFCGVPIQKHVEGTLRIATYYDQAGQVSKVVITKQGPMSITLTNLSTGKVLSSNSAGSEHITYENGQLVSDASNGLYESINVPGLGQVFVEVGRIVFDAQGNIVFEVGEHDIVDFNVTGTFQPTALCQALAS